MALDVLCRLTLTIFRPLSDDGFLTSFLPFRSTFGIFNFFSTMNSKVTTTEGFEPPIFWFEVRRLIRWAMRPVEVFPICFFFAMSDLGEEESGTQCLLSSQCVNLFLCSKLISFELQSSLFSWIRSNWCGWIFFICELRLGSSSKKL